MNDLTGLGLAAIGAFLVVFAAAPLPAFDPMYNAIDASIGLNHAAHLTQGLAGVAFFVLALFRMRD